MKKVFTQRFTVFIFGLLIVGFFVIWLQARAAIRPVQVKEQTQTKNIQADVVNIAPQAQIDITLPFSATEKASVRVGLVLTEEENIALDKSLDGKNYDNMDEATNARLVFNKMLQERNISWGEVKMLFGLDDGYQTLQDSTKYLGKKKLQENL